MHKLQSCTSISIPFFPTFLPFFHSLLPHFLYLFLLFSLYSLFVRQLCTLKNSVVLYYVFPWVSSLNSFLWNKIFENVSFLNLQSYFFHSSLPFLSFITTGIQENILMTQASLMLSLLPLYSLLAWFPSLLLSNLISMPHLRDPLLTSIFSNSLYFLKAHCSALYQMDTILSIYLFVYYPYPLLKCIFCEARDRNFFSRLCTEWLA